MNTPAGGKEQFTPAPSVMDAISKLRGTTPEPEETPEPTVPDVTSPAAAVSRLRRDRPAEVVVEPERRPRRTTAPARTPEPAAQAPEPAAAASAPAPSRKDTVPETAAPTPMPDLGEYVSRVMRDAEELAREYLASSDAEATRRSAVITSHAANEAAAIRDAAIADAERIRADARADAETLVAEQIAALNELAERLTSRTDAILQGADRPDAARAQLARLVHEITTTAEKVATRRPGKVTTVTDEGTPSSKKSKKKQGS